MSTALRHRAIDNRYELKAHGAEKARAGLATDAVWADGKLKVHWSGGNGLYVASPRARLRTLADLWSTATEIRQTFRAWKWAWKLVREVRYVEDAIVLLAQESAQATDLEWNAPVHGASTEATLEHGAAAGFALQRYPVTGALFVDLYRVRSLPFGLGATPAPREDPAEPYPARADLPDDGPMEALCPPPRS